MLENRRARARSRVAEANQLIHALAVLARADRVHEAQRVAHPILPALDRDEQVGHLDLRAPLGHREQSRRLEHVIGDAQHDALERLPHRVLAHEVEHVLARPHIAVEYVVVGGDGHVLYGAHHGVDAVRKRFQHRMHAAGLRLILRCEVRPKRVERDVRRVADGHDEAPDEAGADVLRVERFHGALPGRLQPHIERGLHVLADAILCVAHAQRAARLAVVEVESQRHHLRLIRRVDVHVQQERAGLVLVEERHLAITLGDEVRQALCGCVAASIHVGEAAAPTGADHRLHDLLRVALTGSRLGQWERPQRERLTAVLEQDVRPVSHDGRQRHPCVRVGQRHVRRCVNLLGRHDVSVDEVRVCPDEHALTLGEQPQLADVARSHHGTLGYRLQRLVSPAALVLVVGSVDVLDHAPRRGALAERARANLLHRRALVADRVRFLLVGTGLAKLANQVLDGRDSFALPKHPLDERPAVLIQQRIRLQAHGNVARRVEPLALCHLDGLGPPAVAHAGVAGVAQRGVRVEELVRRVTIQSVVGRVRDAVQAACDRDLRHVIASALDPRHGQRVEHVGEALEHARLLRRHRAKLELTSLELDRIIAELLGDDIAGDRLRAVGLLLRQDVEHGVRQHRHLRHVERVDVISEDDAALATDVDVRVQPVVAPLVRLDVRIDAVERVVDVHAAARRLSLQPIRQPLRVPEVLRLFGVDVHGDKAVLVAREHGPVGDALSELGLPARDDCWVVAGFLAPAHQEADLFSIRPGIFDLRGGDPQTALHQIIGVYACHLELLAINSNQLMRPRQQVLDPLPGWLSLHPQLQILGPVVVAHSVPVVDILVLAQRATQALLHDETMLELHHGSTTVTTNVPADVAFRVSLPLVTRSRWRTPPEWLVHVLAKQASGLVRSAILGLALRLCAPEDRALTVAPRTPDCYWLEQAGTAHAPSVVRAAQPFRVNRPVTRINLANRLVAHPQTLSYVASGAGRDSNPRPGISLLCVRASPALPTELPAPCGGFDAQAPPWRVLSAPRQSRSTVS